MLILPLLIMACNPFSNYEPSSQRLNMRHWAKADPLPLQKVYCYKVLGGEQCVEKPIKGKEHLLLGQHSPAVIEHKKELWEKMNIHPLFGVDADTVREELKLKKVEKNYYEPVQQ